VSLGAQARLLDAPEKSGQRGQEHKQWGRAPDRDGAHDGRPVTWQRE
jgi:hypothetical protein